MRRFDLQLAQALGESMFEKSLREKVSQENNGVRWELGQLQQQLEVRNGDSRLSGYSRNSSIHLQQWTEEQSPGCAPGSCQHCSQHVLMTPMEDDDR